MEVIQISLVKNFWIEYHRLKFSRAANMKNYMTDEELTFTQNVRNRNFCKKAIGNQ
jgi:hypothetical protein